MFNLITTYYKTENLKRQKELDECLKNNFNNKFIDKIYLLNDLVYEIEFIDNHKEKIIQIIVDSNNAKRLGFDYAVTFINTNLQNTLCIISNSDIYFDDTLELLDGYNFDNKFFGLTRYDNGKIIQNSNSQDSWFFKSPLQIDLSQCNFKFGYPGCDNRFAYVVNEAGYKILNPCLTIKTHHLHSSNYRTYNHNDKVMGPYYFIRPTEKENETKT
jgi:hypothetical protein